LALFAQGEIGVLDIRKITLCVTSRIFTVRIPTAQNVPPQYLPEEVSTNDERLYYRSVITNSQHGRVVGPEKGKRSYSVFVGKFSEIRLDRSVIIEDYLLNNERKTNSCERMFVFSM